MTRTQLEVYSHGITEGYDEDYPEFCSTSVIFYADDEDDGEVPYVFFEGHVCDLEGDTFYISGNADEFDIKTEDMGYVKLGPRSLKELTYILERAKKLKAQLSRAWRKKARKVA